MSTPRPVVPTGPVRNRMPIYYTAAPSILALVAPALAVLVYQSASPLLALAPINRQPFTITTTQKVASYKAGETVAAGNMEVIKVEVMAMRSDGSSIIKRTMVTRGTTEREIQVADGRYTIAFDEVRKRTDYPHNSSALLDRLDPNQDCLRTYAGFAAFGGFPVDGHETINNLRTVRIRGGAAGWSYTTWLSLDYGCAIVRDDSIYTYSGKAPDGSLYLTRNLTELASVQEGEPDPQLYLSDSSEDVKPSQRIIARMEFEATAAGHGPVAQSKIDALMKRPQIQKADAQWEERNKK